MRPVTHLANLDLNLLVALRELTRERSVTRAAQRLGVTQPSASAAPSRLRRHFGDELLVREHGEYVLTSLGEQLAEQVEVVCSAAERLFAASSDFGHQAGGNDEPAGSRVPARSRADRRGTLVASPVRGRHRARLAATADHGDGAKAVISR